MLLALGGALYGGALGCDFVWDDRLTAAVGPPDLLAAVTARTGPFYRPVVMLSFALDRGLWGGSPVGFHAVNLTLHLAVAWLLGALAEGVGLGTGVALAAALLFAAHPVQTEAVTYVSGRTDLLCALFVLLSLLAWRRSRRLADGWAIASATALGAALLAKEAAVAVPLALLVPGAHPAARPPRPLLPLLVAGLWAVAWSAAGGAGLRLAGLAARLPAVAIAALTYLRLLLWPAGLHLERFTAVAGWPAPVVVAAWVALAALAAGLVLVARRVPAGGFFVALAALAYAPVSGVVPVYPAIADRALFTPEHFLYLPLLGLAPLTAAALAEAWPRRARRAAPVVLAAVLVAWGAVVVRRNRDWRDEETLFRQTIAYQPPAGRVWFNLGNLALARGDLEEATRFYAAALAREPRDAPAHVNLGIALQRLGRPAAAEAQYREAIADDALLGEAYRGLAGLLVARGATEEANDVLGRWRALRR